MNLVTSYRLAVQSAISQLRSNFYQASGFKHFPSDREIADFLSITPQAFSNIVRGCSSASGITLLKILHELDDKQIDILMGIFSDNHNEN